jgi:predicted PurR-regulated permease PerM
MTTKIKIIVIIVIVLFIVGFYVGLFTYINKLNSKISDLNATITEQNNEIDSLKCNIDSLNKNVKVFGDTLNITSDYISSVKKISSEDTSIKQAIYEKVIIDDSTREWFNETLPADIINVLNNNASIGMCEDNH